MTSGVRLSTSWSRHENVSSSMARFPSVKLWFNKWDSFERRVVDNSSLMFRPKCCASLRVLKQSVAPGLISAVTAWTTLITTSSWTVCFVMDRSDKHLKQMRHVLQNQRGPAQQTRATDKRWPNDQPCRSCGICRASRSNVNRDEGKCRSIYISFLVVDVGIVRPFADGWSVKRIQRWNWYETKWFPSVHLTLFWKAHWIAMAWAS